MLLIYLNDGLFKTRKPRRQIAGQSKDKTKPKAPDFSRAFVFDRMGPDC
jgi:hypothetical protein